MKWKLNKYLYFNEINHSPIQQIKCLIPAILEELRQPIQIACLQKTNKTADDGAGRDAAVQIRALPQLELWTSDWVNNPLKTKV